MYSNREIRRNLSAIEKIELWKVIRITSRIYRFLENCRNKEKLSDLVKTNETEKDKAFWIKHKQGKFETTDNFKEDQSQLNLHKNGTGNLNSLIQIKNFLIILIS